MPNAKTYDSHLIAAIILFYVDWNLLGAFGRPENQQGFPLVAHIVTAVSNLLFAMVFMTFPFRRCSPDVERRLELRRYRVGTYLGAMMVYGLVYLFRPNPEVETTLLTKLICGLALLLDGVILAKLMMYYLFGLMRWFLTKEKYAWFWSIVIGGVVSYQLLVRPSSHSIVIPFGAGYIVGLLIVKWMAIREWKEYCRRGY